MKPIRIAAALALASSGLLASSQSALSSQSGLVLPLNGELGFVVTTFVQPVIYEPEACPGGPTPKLREAFLETVSPEERTRLLLPENEPEYKRLWQAQALGPGGANLCSQPDMFERPLQRTVQSPRSYGLDLDGGDKAGTCAQPEFVSPEGQSGIDNQEYRAMGCAPEWRGNNTSAGGEQESGTRQFLLSGEWTQAILLRGVDSLENDPEVEVIYGNTPDRPMVDSRGRVLAGASFTISETLPRHRNVLKGKIVAGVLTTEPADIVLTQTWGQGGARDIRGNRTKWDFRRGRLRLVFQADGTLAGLLGGYRPVFDVIQSPALGGAGSPLSAGIDCASRLATLRKYADGLRDPRTGQCEGVSSAIKLVAVPAFVNDAVGR